MKRPLFLNGIFFLSLLFTLASFIPFRGENLTEDVLSQTNQFRKSKGKPALVMREELNAIAKKHSENMAKGKIAFGHGGFNQRETQAKKDISGIHSFAENVAFGATTAKEVVTMWKGSTGHRRNMLGDYKYIGIGTAKDRDGRIYYTQVFAD